MVCIISGCTLPRLARGRGGESLDEIIVEQTRHIISGAGGGGDDLFQPAPTHPIVML